MSAPVPVDQPVDQPVVQPVAPVLAYRGEYAVEVGCFVPYMHFLKSRGCAVAVDTYAGMRPYYFFLEPHEVTERSERRDYVSPCDRGAMLAANVVCDERLFSSPAPRPPELLPPPFWDHFRRAPLRWPGGDDASKPVDDEPPVAVVQNKYNSEWSMGMHNFFDLDELAEVVDALAGYRVVYVRTNALRSPDYSHDHNEADSFDLGDKEWLRTHRPEVVLVEDLLDANPGLGFNEVKCRLLARAAATVSTIGGHNYFAAYFPARHLVYKKFTPSDIFDAAFYQRMHDFLCPRPGPVVWAESREDLRRGLETLRRGRAGDACDA